jgi:hypothetical protein
VGVGLRLGLDLGRELRDADRREDRSAVERRGRRIRAGKQPIALAYGLGSVWIADYGAPQLLRVDPRRGRIIQATRLPGAHLDVLADGAAVWVVSEEGYLTRVDPRTGRRTGRIGGGSDPTFVTRCRGSLWVTNFKGETLWQVDGRSAKIERRIAIGSGAAGIACTGIDLWIAKYYENRVVRIARPPKVAAGPATGAGPTDVLASFGSVWVASSGDGTVERLPVP